MNTTTKCFNSFFLSAVDERGRRDKNVKLNVFAERMELLANSCYGYQIMDDSRYTVTKYLMDKKRHAAFFRKMFENKS